MSKIYDFFPFFNELNLLKIRFETLDNVVDYYVICEASTTFSGKTKPLVFSENKEFFAKWQHKIIHLECDVDDPTLTPFEREWFQRDYFKTALDKLLEADDVMIYSDVDEIPKPDAVRNSIDQLQAGSKFAHLAQDLYYYFFNLVEVSGTLLSAAGEYPGVRKRDRKWLGPLVSRWSDISGYTLKELRSPAMKLQGVRIADGGWHFSFIGSEKGVDPVTRASAKIDGYAHQEFNNDKIKKKC